MEMIPGAEEKDQVPEGFEEERDIKQTRHYQYIVSIHVLNPNGQKVQINTMTASPP